MVLVAVAFRILLISWVLDRLGTPTNHFQGNEPSHIAAHLLRGEGFASPFTDLPIPTAQQPPLYPLFMAAIFRLFGAFSKISLYMLLAINSLAGGLTAFFLHRVALKRLSHPVALLSAWTWAILPSIAATDITLSSYAFAALAVVLWLDFVPDLAPRARNWILLGIAIALMLLLNPMLALLIPASVCWLNRKQALVILATALVGLAPWYVRNYRVMNHFYPALRDNFGMELYLGNHPGMSGTCDYWTGESPYGSSLPKLGEARFFEARRSEAIAFIQLEPTAFRARSMKRFAAFWFSPWPMVYTFLLAFALSGIKLAPRGLGVFTATLFVSYPLVFYVTQAAWPTAYRHPIEPLILLMAAVPIAQVVAKLQFSPCVNGTHVGKSASKSKEPISQRCGVFTTASFLSQAVACCIHWKNISSVDLRTDNPLVGRVQRCGTAQRRSGLYADFAGVVGNRNRLSPH